MAPCRHRYEDGSPCRSPEPLVDSETGYCRSHAPGASEVLSEQGREGGKATARRYRVPGLDPDALGPLRTHEDAKRWLEAIGRSVVTGKLQDRAAQAGIRAVEAWTKTEGERLTVEVVAELKTEVDRLKRELHGRPNLRVTP